MDSKRVVAHGYDIVGEWYAKHAAENRRDDRDRYTSLLIESLPSGATLLDLGCGAGLPTTQLLAQHFVVTGVDISAQQIARAREEHIPNARFLQADITKLHLAPASFDAVAAFFSIIHVPRHQHPRLLRKIATWLRPGGLFVASLGAQSVAEGVEEDWHGAPMYWSHFDSATNKRLVEDAGLAVVGSEEMTTDEEGQPVTFFWVVARKREAEAA